MGVPATKQGFTSIDIAISRPFPLGPRYRQVSHGDDKLAIDEFHVHYGVRAGMLVRKGKVRPPVARLPETLVRVT